MAFYEHYPEEERSGIYGPADQQTSKVFGVPILPEAIRDPTSSLWPTNSATIDYGFRPSDILLYLDAGLYNGVFSVVNNFSLGQDLYLGNSGQSPQKKFEEIESKLSFHGLAATIIDSKMNMSPMEKYVTSNMDTITTKRNEFNGNGVIKAGDTVEWFLPKPDTYNKRITAGFRVVKAKSEIREYFGRHYDPAKHNNMEDVVAIAEAFNEYNEKRKSRVVGMVLTPEARGNEQYDVLISLV